VREGRAVGERLRHLLGALGKRIGFDQRVVEAPALGFLAGHRATGEEQLGGASVADDRRQQRASAHVGTGQPHLHEQERHLALRRAVTDVRAAGEHGAGTGADAVDCADDRLRHIAHRAHDVARHARELEQPTHVHLGERTDDLVHVAAGAEVAAGAGEHHCLDLGHVGELAKEIAHLGVRLEGQRILALGAVQRKRCHLAVDLETEVLGFQVLRGNLVHRARAPFVVNQPTMLRPPLTLMTWPVM